MEQDMDLPIRFAIQSADYWIQYYLICYLKHKVEWVKGYDEIAEWLTDNQGKGLLLTGGCGLGKTTLAQYIIPYLIERKLNRKVRVVSAYDINNCIDDLKKLELLCIDDLGVEHESVHFGNRRMAFNEIVDVAEKENHFLIVTTNLSSDEIKQKYGKRTLERILATMRCIRLEGPSLRRF